MVAGGVLALILAASAGGQGVPDPGVTGPGPRAESARVGVSVGPDTVRVRRRAVRLSEAYQTRRKIHKIASYAMLPLFVAEFAAGDQLFHKGSGAPQWARDYHPVIAGGVAGLFGVNTLTGSLNWWESRSQSSGFRWRTAHAALMLLADAGFVATGVLADEAEDSPDSRKLHRTVAVSSMSIATVSYLMMLKPFRRD